MLSTEPANGAFFADPAEPMAPAAQEAQPEPVAAEAAAIPSATHESAAGPSAAMIDVPLGTLIFRAGLLDEKQLEDALREGMRTGRRLGEVLVERGWIQERELGRLLAGQKGLPFVEVSASDVEPAALEMLSEENAKLQVVLPLRHEGGQLVVAVADPSNELMLENLRRTLGASPKLVVASYAELVKAIGEAYASPRPEAASEPETVVAEPETPQPESQPPPQAEVERAPVVRPLPIVLRPKERAAEPPPVAEPIAPLTPPAVRPLPIILPRAEEPANEPEPAPAPLLLPPPAQPSAAAEEKPQVEEPEPVAQATETEPVIHEQPAPEPETAAERAPTAPAEHEVLAAQPAPAPEFMLELPVDWPSAGEDPPEEPASPAPPPEEPAPEPPAQEEPASLTAVVLRLQDGATLEVGTFPTVAEAAAEAQEVVIEIAAADRNSTWPFFAQRYLRPDLIISVDLVEASSDS